MLIAVITYKLPKLKFNLLASLKVTQEKNRDLARVDLESQTFQTNLNQKNLKELTKLIRLHLNISICHSKTNFYNIQALQSKHFCKSNS